MFCASNDQTHTRSITTRMNTVVAREGGQEAASATSNNSVLSRSLQLPGQLRGSVLAGGLTAFAYVRAAKQSDSSHAARQEIAPVFSAFLSPQRRAHTGRRQMTVMTCMRYTLGKTSVSRGRPASHHHDVAVAVSPAQRRTHSINPAIRRVATTRVRAGSGPWERRRRSCRWPGWTARRAAAPAWRW